MYSCSDDESFSSDRANVLSFSSDTVSFDTIFTRVATSTRTFWVYNGNDKGLRITNIKLSAGNQTGFRVNVDGTYLSQSLGYQVNNVELRKKDSIRVFVELTASANYKNVAQLIEDNLVFTMESGVQQKVNLRAFAMDAFFMNNEEFKSDTTINMSKPIVVYGGIKVDSGATLTLAAGTKLYFHDGAGIDVYGKLMSMGEVSNNVVMRGDRTDNMFDYLPYDGVSGQWKGLRFYSSSYGNELYNTDIHGAMDGIICDSSNVSKPKLLLYNCIVHNCKGNGIKAFSSVIDIENSQITNALGDCVGIYGGAALLLNCTVAQFYPFSANRGVALRFTNYKDALLYPLYQMEVINTIITGYSDDEVMGDRKDSVAAYTYKFDHCLICTPKIDKDTLMKNIIWEAPDSTAAQTKNFRLDVDKLRYDFRLDSLSRARNAGNKQYSLPYDRNGIARDNTPDIGCYEYVR